MRNQAKDTSALPGCGQRLFLLQLHFIGFGFFRAIINKKKRYDERKHHRNGEYQISFHVQRYFGEHLEAGTRAVFLPFCSVCSEIRTSNGNAERACHSEKPETKNGSPVCPAARGHRSNKTSYIIPDVITTFRLPARVNRHLLNSISKIRFHFHYFRFGSFRTLQHRTHFSSFLHAHVKEVRSTPRRKFH